MVRRAPDHPRGTEDSAAHSGTLSQSLTFGLTHALLASDANEAKATIAIPSFLQAYSSDFDQIYIALDKLDDFYLVPIDVPSRDVARGLVKHLEQRGMGVLLLEPSNWVELAAQLLALPTKQDDPRPVMVLGPRDWRDDLPKALNFLNLKRDTIAAHLGRPLIWCGLRFFLEAMWDHAPDFWSIRNVTIQIPLRAESHVESFAPLNPFARPTRPPGKIKPSAKMVRELGNSPALARVLLEYARALLFFGQTKEATSQLNHAEGILHRRDGAQLTIEDADLRELRADVAFAVEPDAVAEPLFQVALEAFVQTGDVRGQSRIQAKLARITKRRGDMDAANAQFVSALEMAASLGDVSLRGAILFARGSDAKNAEQRNAALEDVNQAIEIFAAQKDDAYRARVLIRRAIVRHDVDDLEGAGVDLDVAIGLLQSSKDPIAWVQAHNFRAHLYFHQNAFDKAERMLIAALRKANVLRDRNAKTHIWYEIGQAKWLQNDSDGAKLAFTRVLETLGSDGKSRLRARAYLYRSKARDELKNTSGALFDAKQARGLSYSIKSLPNRHEFHRWHARLLARTNDLAHAREAMDEALECATDADSQIRADLWSESANLYAQQGDIAKAWEDFEQRIALHRERGQSEIEAQTRVARAEAIVQWAIGSDISLTENMQWIRRTIEDLDGVLARPESVASQPIRAQAYDSRGKLRQFLDEYDSSLRDFDAALAAYVALDDQKREGMLLFCRVTLRCDHGEIAGAEEDLKHAASLFASMQDERRDLVVPLIRSQIAETSGDLDSALHWLETMRAVATRAKQTHCVAFAEALTAKIKFKLGNMRAAQKLAERAIERVQDTRHLPHIKSLTDGVLRAVRATRH